MKVVAINGSPRREGNTSQMIDIVAAELAAENIEVEKLHLGTAPISGCLACYTCSKLKNRKCIIDNDIVNTCIDKMASSDAIILGSPVYFSDISAQMKCLIDRAGTVCRTNGNLLERKVGAGVLAVRRAGATHALSTLNFFFHINQMVMPGSVYWNLAIGRNPGEVLSDEEGVRTMVALGRNMAWLLGKLNS